MTLPTRLDALPSMPRLILLALLLVAAGLAAALPSSPIKTAQTHEGRQSTDPDLYRAIIARVADGQSYYAAAAAEQRARHYPLRPFFTVRLPTLAMLSAWLGGQGIVAGLTLLSIATMAAWVLRLKAEAGRWTAAAAATFIVVQCSIMLGPVMALFHESWAALFIAFSLACWKPGKWKLSLVLGLAACGFRETAAPYLLLMLASALVERRWREAIDWSAGLACIAVILWFHATALSAVTVPGDASSQGWSGLGGWPLLISSLTAATPLALLPSWLGKLLIPLSFLGWAAWRHPLALRLTGLIAGYGVMLMLFARPDNWYWALMPAPALLAGLAFIPAFIRTWSGWRTQQDSNLWPSD